MMDITVPASVALPQSDQNSQRSPSQLERVGYQTSPHAPNTPENNTIMFIEYRRVQVACFSVNGRRLICLPQAFEFFLKHLVGGLHTVYTKLKRLEITPVVCNVDQVRVLRSRGAIQPGVNRCKLISPQEFDVLYEDCTSSSARPGRPPKRSSFFSAADLAEISPNKQMRKIQEPIFQFDDLKASNGNPAAVGMLSPHHPGYPPMPLPGIGFVSPYQINFMHQAAVQMALASQLHSNLARAKESMPTMPFHLSHITAKQHLGAPVITNHQSPDLLVRPFSSPLMPKAAKIESTLQAPKIHKVEQELQEDGKNDDFHHNNVPSSPQQRPLSPDSCCSDDLNVDDDIPHSAPVSGKNSYPYHHLMPTPPPSSPREMEEPIVQPGKCDSYQEADDRRTGINCLINKKKECLAGPVLETRQITERNEDERRRLDDILINLKSDIRSFMDSVVQHQEDILSDIEMLRNRLRTQRYSQEFIDTFMKEQQQTKEIYKAQMEKDSLHKQQINSSLQHIKSDLNNQWWNRNTSLNQ